ncbi:hypothetical protein D3C81_1947510 [compost metagenome]
MLGGNDKVAGDLKHPLFYSDEFGLPLGVIRNNLNSFCGLRNDYHLLCCDIFGTLDIL